MDTKPVHAAQELLRVVHRRAFIRGPLVTNLLLLYLDFLFQDTKMGIRRDTTIIRHILRQLRVLNRLNHLVFVNCAASLLENLSHKLRCFGLGVGFSDFDVLRITVLLFFKKLANSLNLA